ncbi:hypothetical protein DFH29DRAFT_812887 [Suillus ampliporus]|nr:hypothetical protein DFH29DRAFT_812887 [Suillus ampliporus]
MSSIVMSVMQGPLYGTLATMLLYGVICMQTFHYWQAYENDGKILKCLVILILETAHAALSIYCVEFYLIMHFGDVTNLEYAVWCVNLVTQLLFQTHTETTSYFIWRIRQCEPLILTSSRARILAGFGLGNCSLRHYSFRYPMWKNFKTHAFQTMLVGWVLSAVIDSAIAFMTCIYLRKHLSPPLRESQLFALRTDNILNRLLLYSINTGAVTSFFAILVIIMFFSLPTTLAYLGFVQVQNKFYAISLLASLNTRKSKDTLEKNKQPVPTACSALSLLPSFLTFKTSRPKSMHLVCTFTLLCDYLGLKPYISATD